MTELLLVVAAVLFAVLIIFGGMFALCWRLVGALDMALAREQAPLPATHPVPAPTTPAAPLPAAPAKPAALPSPAPKAATDDGTPDWFTWAQHEIGFHEVGDNQGIERYITLGKCGALGQPWCMIFVNAALESTGHPGTRSPASQSIRNNPNFVQIPGPALGAITVYWRGSESSDQGHVGFYVREDATHVWTLGGNESDMVQIEALPKSTAAFGLRGYWWPKAVPLPTIGAITSTAATPAKPASQQNGVHTGIVATVFNDAALAYGGSIGPDTLGVALPFRFSGTRPKVRITNHASGASADADVIDVGPWNTNDPYWQTSTRPQAESGVDQRGRKTNKAGIDLTIAAAKALQIDGKGLVDWQFIESASPDTPKVV